jgi:hypothetical protein
MVLRVVYNSADMDKRDFNLDENLVAVMLV